MKKPYIIPDAVMIAQGGIPDLLAGTWQPDHGEAKEGSLDFETEEENPWDIEEQKHYDPWE